MEFENDNYISKLLTDSSKIENFNDLLSFLERLDPDRIEKQIGVDNTTFFRFSDELHPKYLMYEKHWLKYLSTLRNIILSGETNLSRVVKQIQDALTIKRPNEMEKAVFFDFYGFDGFRHDKSETKRIEKIYKGKFIEFENE